MVTAALDRISVRKPVALWLLVGVFVATRLFGVASAINYGAVSDVEIAYRRWAVRVVERDRPPYSDVDIEYPPGSLPFVLAPQLTGPDEHGYRINFVALMLLADVTCLIGLLLLSKRWGSLLGPWVWVLGIPLLGSLVYLRLDLVPAAATIWAMYRASKDDWLGSGALLGFGAAVKLYPLLLVPLALMMCPKDARKRLLLGVGGVIALALLPFVTILGDVFREVVEYHTGRGIQIESLWGSILFIARSSQRSRLIVHDFGAHHFTLGAVPELKLLASAATLLVATAGVWLARRGRDKVTELASVSFVTLMLAISVTAVLSPQFFIWVLAMGAAATCVPNPRVRNQVLMLIPITAITHLIFPVLHANLVYAEPGAVVVLWARNILLLMTAIFALARQSDTGEGSGVVAEPVSA